MSYAKSITHSLASSFGSKGLLLLLNLLLLPILIRFLGTERAGLWMLLGQSLGFLNIFDFGLTPTLTRRIAFASSAVSENQGGSEPELAATLAAGRFLTRWIAFLVILVALPLGFLVVHGLSLPRHLHQEGEMVWIAVVVSYAATVWGLHWGCLLRGLGHVTQSNLIVTATQVLMVLVQLVLAIAGAGLLALAIAQGICFILGNVISYRLLRKLDPNRTACAVKVQRPVVVSLLSTSLKCWLTSLGALLILKTDHYFIAFRCGLDAIPQYQAAYLIVFYVYQVAVNLSGASTVYVSKYWIEQRIPELQEMVLRFARWGCSLMVIGCLSVLTLSPFLFEQWLRSNEFIGFPVLGIFCIMLSLEAHHVLFADFARATENEVFVASALGAGFLNLALTWWLSAKWGIVGIALGTLLAQALTNNWIVVYVSLNRLRIGWEEYVRSVLRPLIWLLLLIAPMVVSKVLYANSLWVALGCQVWLLLAVIGVCFTTERPLGKAVLSLAKRAFAKS
jgi:O-antigen/teichoic acid export membrane protein